MLELKMRGYPRPTIKWTKDGQPIDAKNNRFKFVEPDPETVALIISKVAYSYWYNIHDCCMVFAIPFRWRLQTRASMKCF